MTLTQWGARWGLPIFVNLKKRPCSRGGIPRVHVRKKPSILDNPVKPIFKNNSISRISLTVKPDRMSFFSSLLGQGFIFKARAGLSVRNLLCRQIGMGDDFLDQRIQTIFLDGKVVDNVDTAIIRQGSTLALSAAMPGLAGATLRRGGAYAAMRSQISHKNNTVDGSAETGTVMLKLFNLVALELGPVLLKQGIWVSGKIIENFFRKTPDFFWNGCLNAEIDGISQDVRKISRMEWKQQQVFLKLETSEETP